jgi:integrase
LGNEINRIKILFKYGFDAGLIDKPVRYGPTFKRPSKRVLRIARKANGSRMYEADELQSIIDAASQPLKAMVLLGINCGFGQTDVANLPRLALNLEAGWVDFPRPKTGVERRCPLWAQTVEALREASTHRPTPKDQADADLVFVTKYGQRWVRNSSGAKQSWVDSVGAQFGKLLQRLGLKRNKLSFYALRHTFETIGGEARDQVAVDHIMGHARNDMASLYRERISDQRLKRVTDFIRGWLTTDISDTSP